MRAIYVRRVEGTIYFETQFEESILRKHHIRYYDNGLAICEPDSLSEIFNVVPPGAPVGFMPLKQDLVFIMHHNRQDLADLSMLDFKRLLIKSFVLTPTVKDMLAALENDASDKRDVEHLLRHVLEKF